MRYDESAKGPLREHSGASFCTHRLVRDGGAKLLLKPTIGSMLFSGVFIMLGVMAVLAGTFALFHFRHAASLVMIVVGGGFTLVGLWLRRVMAGTREIDLATRRVRVPEMVGLTDIRLLDIPFDEISSLQIIKKTVYGEHYYDSFELNIVRHNGKRTNLLDHSGQNQIEEAAEQISAFVGCEVSAVDYSE